MSRLSSGRHVLCIIITGMLSAAGAAQPAAACLNGPGREDSEGMDEALQPPQLSTGQRQAAAYRELLAPPRFDIDLWKAKIADYQRQDMTRASADDRTNYALALVYGGQFAQAKTVLEQLEAAQPGGYYTASNLGTVDELLGDNQHALQWISEGIKRNPGSHEGTEWLHVKILQAKLALAADPAWLSQHSVLGLDFGSDTEPRLPAELGTGNSGQPLRLEDLKTALTYQLKERLKFVRTAEPVVADLLTDLGSVLVLSKEPEAAEVAYMRAQEFGARGPVLTRRLAYARNLRQHGEQLAAEQRGAPNYWLLGSGVVVVAVCGALVVRARRRRR